MGEAVGELRDDVNEVGLRGTRRKELGKAASFSEGIRPARVRARRLSWPGQAKRWAVGEPAEGSPEMLHFLHCIGHGFSDFFKLFIGVQRGDGGADEVLASGDGWGDRHDGENTLFEKRFPE
jgi:hypothetical protein